MTGTSVGMSIAWEGEDALTARSVSVAR